MLSIGEFSHAARLTVKALRYYHELGILQPAKIDDASGYRYYDYDSLQRAAAISSLKDLGFSLKEIQGIFRDCESDEELNRYIVKKLTEVRKKRAELGALEQRLNVYHEQSQEHVEMKDIGNIEEFVFELKGYVSYRIIGKYSDLGQGYKHLYKQFGRYITGSPYAFYYNMEYVEDNVVMDAVVKLKNKPEHDTDNYFANFSSQAVKITHKGAYGTQGAAYAKLFAHCRDKGYEVQTPFIEHYIKGPGLILKGNPQNYITECIVLISNSTAVDDEFSS